MFLQLFGGNQCPVQYLNRSRYLQCVMQTTQSRLSFSEEFKMLNSLEVLLFFYGLTCVESLVRLKSVRALGNEAEHNGTTNRFVNQMIVKAFSALHHVDRLQPPSKVIVPYIIYDRQLILFTVLSLRVNGFAFITQRKSLEDVTGILSRLEGVDLEACDRTSGKDSAFSYITFELFDMLYVAIGNNVL